MWSQLSGTFAVNAGICFLESQGSFHELSWGPWPSWKGICFQGKRSKSQTDAGWVSDTTEERNLNQGLGSEVIRVLPAGMSLDISGQRARWDKERLLLQDGSAWPGLNPPLLMILPPPHTPQLLLPGVLELPPAQHRAWGSKTPFPDSSFPLSNAEVELSPTSTLWSFTFCFAPAGAGGARRVLVALDPCQRVPGAPGKSLQRIHAGCRQQFWECRAVAAGKGSAAAEAPGNCCLCLR